jgi:predicted ribosome quality control (RQC) complex YloA/Tae2 family protein
MGRHSNLIFWDKNTEKILGASHFVTKEMSRQREVVPGLKYVRPPVPEKENIFCISEEKFDAQLKGLSDKLVAGEGTNGVVPVTLEQWLIDSYSGLGKHLAEDLVSAAQLPSRLPKEGFDPASVKAPLWQQIHEMQSSSSYKPGMALDFSRYTILHAAGAARAGEQWKQFPAVNDMVEEYFRALEVKEQFHQLRERLRSEIKAESEKLQGRLNAAVQQLQDVESPDVFKKHGDLVLANMNEIGAGQESLVCEDLYNSDTRQIEIKLNPNLSPSQNAQNFYRQFAKHRARQSAATLARQEVNSKLAVLQKHLDSLDAATGTEELKALRDNLIPRKQEVRKSPPPEAQRTARPQKQRLMQVNSSDGWTIYVGRNRHENDHLLTRLAQPNDIWLHILGQGGAHVLIRVPASKQDPPQTTLKEAALIAARMSKVSYGTKVRVVYTQIKHVKKVAKDKPGLVRYENEKTIEVDTGQPVPAAIKQVFSHRETQ